MCGGLSSVNITGSVRKSGTPQGHNGGINSYYASGPIKLLIDWFSYKIVFNSIMRPSKHPHQPQSHSVELIFAP